jgi:hypothetical protein
MEAPNINTCQCYLPKLKRFCSRKPNPGDIYCYQHNNGKCKHPVGPNVVESPKVKSPKVKSPKVKSPVKPKSPKGKSPVKSPIKVIGEPGNYLTGVPDVDIGILLRLDYDDLIKTCTTNKYAASLCADDRLWIQKTTLSYGDQITAAKPADVGWREYYESFGLYQSDAQLKHMVKTVLSQVHPDTKIGSKAVQLMLELLKPLVSKLSHMSAQEFNSKVLPGELGKHANAQYRKANNKLAIVDYLIGEMMELSGNAARDNRVSTITQWHIYLALINDEELLKLFQDHIKPFPYIDPAMDQPYKKNTLKIKDIKDEWKLGVKPNKVLRNIAYYLVVYYLGKSRGELGKLIDALEFPRNDDLPPIFELQYAVLGNIVNQIEANANSVKSRVGFEEILDATVNNPVLNRIIPLNLILAPGTSWRGRI